MKKMEKIELVTLSVDDIKLVNGGVDGEIYGEGTYSSSGGDVKVGIKIKF
ncbi:MAG TPA: hypothetical protein VHU81_14575 [Thermoanaerobaculia bacterium]|jgi:hypothetical protein|nr:hypothetical protein [Thermoanaerobaculia bacterium]